MIKGLKKNLDMLSKKQGIPVKAVAEEPTAPTINPEIEEIVNNLRAELDALRNK